MEEKLNHMLRAITRKRFIRARTSSEDYAVARYIRDPEVVATVFAGNLDLQKMFSGERYQDSIISPCALADWGRASGGKSDAWSSDRRVAESRSGLGLHDPLRGRSELGQDLQERLAVEADSILGPTVPVLPDLERPRGKSCQSGQTQCA